MNNNIAAVKEAFAKRAQMGGGGEPQAAGGAPMGGMGGGNPMMDAAAARQAPQGGSNGAPADGEAMFILKVLAKRLEALPPHKPEKPMMEKPMMPMG